MHYVIIRDDDTNALTPPECLERLYRPFLEAGLPVNLAVIPNVATNTRTVDGRPEGYLHDANTAISQPVPAQHALSLTSRFSGVSSTNQTRENRSNGFTPRQQTSTSQRHGTLPIAANRELVTYLLNNTNYHIVQHGCRHEFWEFDRLPHPEIGARLEEGTRLLLDSGFARPKTFVAPYDKLSRESLLEVARRFRVLSTGWYELRRLPWTWQPNYALKKIRASPHWQVGQTLLLSHPGCLLSYLRPYNTMLDAIIQQVHGQRLTVLVTHWWEYFRNGQPDEAFIEVLHETGHYLARHPAIKVISFSELLERDFPVD